jgi:hypothetical protein
MQPEAFSFAASWRGDRKLRTMADPPAQDDPARAGAGRLGKRIGILTVILIAVLFIGSSTAHIVADVFGFGIRPLPSGPPGSSVRTCAEGVRALSTRIGDGASETEPGPSSWDPEGSLYRACAASPEGLDTWAALLRLRTAHEQLPHASREQLDPLRRAVWAHLPTDLR